LIEPVLKELSAYLNMSLKKTEADFIWETPIFYIRVALCQFVVYIFSTF
jgi:hypothetical protein